MTKKKLLWIQENQRVWLAFVELTKMQWDHPCLFHKPHAFGVGEICCDFRPVTGCMLEMVEDRDIVTKEGL